MGFAGFENVLRVLEVYSRVLLSLADEQRDPEGEGFRSEVGVAQGLEDGPPDPDGLVVLDEMALLLDGPPVLFAVVPGPHADIGPDGGAEIGKSF